MTLLQFREQLRALRIARRPEAARQLIQAQSEYQDDAALQALAWEHEDFWWEPLVGKRVTLERRDGSHTTFVRACWENEGFMLNFNRSARRLPASDAVLSQVLERERAATLSELHALHWTVCTDRGPVGFVSATDHSKTHRRCEFLIGFPGLQRAVAMEATQLAMEFLRNRVGVERLTAHFYPENIHAIKVATKFGFQQEGIMKAYFRNSDGTRSDLVIAGLLLTDELPARRWRIRQENRKSSNPN